MKRRVDLVLDGDGDVIMVRVDHHSGSGGRDVKVNWQDEMVTPGTSVVSFSYNYPPRAKAKAKK